MAEGKRIQKGVLAGLGLQPREERVYTAVLRGGKVSQSDIAAKTSINRTSLYPILSALCKKDLLIKTVSGKRIFYTATNPEKLFRKLQKTQEVFAAALPGLVDAYKTAGHKPKISVLDGEEGVYRATLDAVENARSYLKSFSSPNNFLSVLERKDADYLIARIEERGLLSYSISSNTPENKKLLPTFSQKSISWKLMPEGIVYPVEFLIYNNVTVITSWPRQFSVVIESEDITIFLESIFDYFWNIGATASKRA